MRQRTYSTEAVILARRNFGEADRLVTLFSKHYGKLRVLAKGVRRPKSRKRGDLETFNQVRLLLARGRNLDIITETELKNSFSSWRKNLARIGVAYHLAEVVNRLTAEEQESKQIFDLLVDSFSKLSTAPLPKLYSFAQKFKIRVLEELGYLEKGKPFSKNLDTYIEDLINGRLRTKNFLERLK